MDKTFTVAGTSVLNGKTKVRFANDLVSRIKVLGRNGHDAINLIELPQAMDKASAAKYISAQDAFSGIEEQAAIAQFLGKRDAEEPAPAPVAPKAKKAAKAKVAEAA
jgi:hypothetical protein